MRKYSSRKKFRESLGASCANTQWSWSWVNHEERKIYFGASDVHQRGNVQMILSRKWKRNLKGRKNSGYPEALANINHVLSDGYELYTFKQIEELGDPETGRAKIVAFEQDLEKRYLIEKNEEWFALPLDDFEPTELWDSPNVKVVFLEGSRIPISSTRIERNARAREACLDYHGHSCSVCDFDFQKVYGELGKTFIHVHHLKPIGK